MQKDCLKEVAYSSGNYCDKKTTKQIWMDGWIDARDMCGLLPAILNFAKLFVT